MLTVRRYSPLRVEIGSRISASVFLSLVVGRQQFSGLLARSVVMTPGAGLTVPGLMVCVGVCLVLTGFLCALILKQISTSVMSKKPRNNKVKGGGCITTILRMLPAKDNA